MDWGEEKNRNYTKTKKKSDERNDLDGKITQNVIPWGIKRVYNR